tara:strand:- start:30 stop:470 length:441 start_codon:yes stop_codon:yes gene_type:complete
LLPVAAFRPIAQKLSSQTSTGGCEVISRQPEELAAVSLTCLQGCDQIEALVDLVAVEPNHLIARLQVLPLDQAQCFPGAWAEFGADSQAWSDDTKQRNRLIRSEVVEAKRYKAAAVSASVWCEQMQFATQAVAKTQRWRQLAQAVV